MQKKILFAGGSYSDIPMIEAAKDLNLFVITSGNNPLEKGHALSDKYVLADFSDKDAILKIAKDLQINAICSSSNDFSVISAAYVAEQMGLPGFDSYQTTLILHHKNLFREFGMQINLPLPKTKIFSNRTSLYLEDVKGLSFPLMVKPVDLTGGKGIKKIMNSAEFPLDLREILLLSHNKNIVVEEFIEGSLHTYSTFIVNQKVVFDYTDNEFSYINPYLVSTSSAPGSFSDTIKNKLKIEVEKLAKKLNLVDGLLHSQFILEKNSFKFIEFTRRCSGDFYSIPVEMGTNFKHAKAIVLNSLGAPFLEISNRIQKGFFSRHCSMASKAGIFKGIDISKEIQGNIVNEFPLLLKDEYINNYLTTKASIFFLKYENEKEMQEKTARINELIKVLIDD